MKAKSTKMLAAEMSPLSRAEGTPNAQPASAAEPYVTLRHVCTHFGMSRVTVWRNVKEGGMQVHRVGKGHRVRFLMSEVQDWLEKNQRERFAANGKRSAIEEARRRLIMIPMLNGLEIVAKEKQRSPS